MSAEMQILRIEANDEAERSMQGLLLAMTLAAPTKDKMLALVDKMRLKLSPGA